MIISSTASVLDPAGFGTPDLAALKPDVSSYKAILFQPHGDIEVSASGVRHRNRDLAVAQFGGFLRVANETRADLAICPEYSMPWNVLIDAINSGQRPPGRGLWIFGCESIRYSELDHARAALTARVGRLLRLSCSPLGTLGNSAVRAPAVSKRPIVSEFGSRSIVAIFKAEWLVPWCPRSPTIVTRDATIGAGSLLGRQRLPPHRRSDPDVGTPRRRPLPVPDHPRCGRSA